jgi:prepilin-type N-terminal cleavage/methylation domain-containing protein
MRGFSLLEVLFSLAIAATLVGIAVPVTSSAVDEIRTAAAARHLAGKILAARIDAVRRSSSLALRFEPDGDDYVITTHIDGNGNGVRTAEIRSGIDSTLGTAERIRDSHPHVRFGLAAGIPDLDGGISGSEGVRVGAARLLSVSPLGGTTSGTLYLHGRRSQYAVRVLGATGRVRVFQYDPGARQWNTR